MSMNMLIIAAVLVIAVIVVIRSLAVQRGKRRVQAEALTHLGFLACPDQKAWLEETVAFIENNHGYLYQVSDPQRLPGDPPIYFFKQTRRRQTDEAAVAEEVVLFPLKRPSEEGIFLFVKPTSLPSGPAATMLGALATGPWDALPDDLKRSDVPMDLKNTNLVGILAPPNMSLYDLIDAKQLGSVLAFGDAGGMFVQCRGSWCSVSSPTARIPFQVEKLVASIQPLF
jgi:hypothetical protein